MADRRWTQTDLRNLELYAKALVETGMRNSQLEDLHAGTSPESATGDFNDVKVVSPYGEIPWARVSRLSDEEMKALMIEVVDRVFTILRYPEELVVLGAAARWNRPQLHPGLMKTVRRRRLVRKVKTSGEQDRKRP